MTHHGSTPDPFAEQRAQLQQAMAGMTSSEIAQVAQQLLASAGAGPGDLLDTPPPSRRRPRRDDVVTYQVRVDLVGAKPPIWRRLELDSDLFLDDVHEILQAAFGWLDCHLHRFGVGPHIWDRSTEAYLCPYEVDEGEAGTPASQVRLDEVLVEAGDVLHYVYDFGDDWDHILRLEAVRPRQDGAARARCSDGRRAGPPEDCGGIHGYQEMLEAKDDPDHPEYALAREMAQAYEGQLSDPGAFDREEVNEVLAGLEPTILNAPRVPDATALPGPVADLLRRCHPPEDRQLAAAVHDARLDEPVLIDAEAAAAMVHPFSWLLDHVGGDGIKLTAAGYLPPVHVEAAMEMLRPRHDWIGKANREDQTYPVLDLRQDAQQLGLLRKYRGRLLLTRRGSALRDDPVDLWWYLAERLPVAPSDDYRFDGGLLELLRLAGGGPSPGRPARLEQDLGIVTALGWRPADGGEFTDLMVSAATRDTVMLLTRLGAYEPDDGLVATRQPTPQGSLFARAALTTWGERNVSGR